jgi:uroporphyrinogen decarboxylase
MNSRERILKSLNHKEPDRIPRDLGGTESSGLTAYSLHKLNNLLELKNTPKIFEPYQYVAYIPDELRDKFRIDTANLTPEPKKWIEVNNPMAFTVLLPELWKEEYIEDGSTVIRKDNGTISAKRCKNGYYFDPVNPPLQHLEKAEELDKHKEIIFSFDYPAFADESLEDIKLRSEEIYKQNKCTVFNLCCHILAAGQLLRGYEIFMIDLLTNEKMVNKLFDLLIEGYCDRIDRFTYYLKNTIDVVLLNDDLGTQNGPMLPPSIYRSLIKPYQSRLFSHVKKVFNKPILFHSCGAIREFIPDLIEMGVDALNPVQVSAEGMNIRELKKDFGKDITFWGGGIDTQTVLNRKTPDEIVDHIRETVDIMAPGGGFVFCQVHNIQPDVPPENIIAMYNALVNIG